jgi:hypothetical protein
MSEGFEGWFYKQNGEALGPLSQRQIQELVSSGQLHPRQAVWTHGSYGLLFVHAAAAASEPGIDRSTVGRVIATAGKGAVVSD